MKLQSSKLLQLAAIGSAGLALAQSIQAATVLSGTGIATNDWVPSNHGSNAIGTPDVVLSWTPAGIAGSPSEANSWQSYNGWPSGGGQVYQLDGPGAGYTGAVTYSVAFTPSAATIAVLLTSLTLNDWSGPATPALANTTLNWSVVGSISGILGSATGLAVTDGTAPQLNLNFQGVGGETLTLNLTPTGGAGSYFAVDNLSFDQVSVPEPSGAILAAAGLGALALRRRRR